MNYHQYDSIFKIVGYPAIFSIRYPAVHPAYQIRYPAGYPVHPFTVAHL
jgi:hypothetical protein